MIPPPLRELQLRLRALIARAPASPADFEQAVAALPIRSHGALSAAERVRVYADMHFLRMRDALAEDYPAVRRAIGGERFAKLVRAYVAEHPSDRPSLRDLGRHLPFFLARSSVPDGPPWLAELAAFEWALVEAFDAPDDAVLRAPDLRALPPERWPGLRLEPVRSLLVLEARAPVDALRERLLADGDTGDVALEPVVLCVWRQELTVFHRRIDTTEHEALQALAAGASFEALCARLAASVGEAEAGPTALRLLHRWLEDDLLRALDASLPSPGAAGT